MRNFLYVVDANVVDVEIVVVYDDRHIENGYNDSEGHYNMIGNHVDYYNNCFP